MDNLEVVECKADMMMDIKSMCEKFLNRAHDGRHESSQLVGFDFFETYASVVQWTTACLMLILENLLGMIMKQADVTAAFLHATLGEDKKAYVEMPLAFKWHGSNEMFKVLCLKKTIYCLHQSPCAFWKYLTEKLGNCGLPQAPFGSSDFID
ncbi:hypothetical protein ACHAXS_001612 [Conticribra weissflogii]